MGTWIDGLNQISNVINATAGTIAGFSSANKSRTLTREGWDRQEAEAERNRQFNAEQAELAREYYSPVNQMKLMDEAGLNSAMIAGNTATSGASASGSPASLSSPTLIDPSRAIFEGNDALNSAISNFYNFKKAEAEVGKIGAETGNMLERLVMDKVQQQYTLPVLSQQFRNLIKDEILKDTEVSNLRQSAKAELQLLAVERVKLYNMWFGEQTRRLNLQYSMVDGFARIELEEHKFNEMVKDMRNRLYLQKDRMQWEFGLRHKRGKQMSATRQSSENQTNVHSSMWNVNGELDLASSTKFYTPTLQGFNLGARLEIEGGYSSTDTETRSNGYSVAGEVGVDDQFEEFFANTKVGKTLAFLEACLLELDAPKLDANYRNKLLNRVVQLNTSYDTWEMLYFNPALQSVDSSFK